MVFEKTKIRPLNLAEAEKTSFLRPVFWLEGFSLLGAPSQLFSQWLCAPFVPSHSGGSAPDLHRFPEHLRKSLLFTFKIFRYIIAKLVSKTIGHAKYSDRNSSN
jgi:hypothetical protein